MLHAAEPKWLTLRLFFVDGAVLAAADAADQAGDDDNDNDQWADDDKDKDNDHGNANGCFLHTRTDVQAVFKSRRTSPRLEH